MGDENVVSGLYAAGTVMNAWLAFSDLCVVTGWVKVAVRDRGVIASLGNLAIWLGLEER